MHETARAKVNLYLHVTGRRADGYHLLDSLAVFPGAADGLSAEPAEHLSLAVQGPFGAGLAAEPDNLVLRAARALQRATGTRAGAVLRLDKHLPVASGIGGGSADAAAALRLLAALWDVPLPEADLAQLAAALGADVPVCLASRPARMGGIGDVLRPAPALPACGILLVNPGVAVSTPAVFRARSPGFTPEAELPAAWPEPGAMARDLARFSNDLETPALACCPAIGPVLDWLRARPGCLLARMSGSGATCFALFPDAETARQVAGTVPARWWGWGGDLH
jgi:4-diphosphocytidyl-2-C-methyl-D-erythritol kinase